MKYLFDTDHITFLQQPSSREFAAIGRRSLAHSTSDLAYSMVSFHEQVVGAHNLIVRAKSVGDILRGYRFFGTILSNYSRLTVLPFDGPVAAEFARLQAIPVRIKTMDLRIAAIALVNNLILLTRNARDFTKVQGLIIEDWTV